MDIKLPNSIHNELVRSHPEMFTYGRVRERDMKKILVGAGATDQLLRKAATAAATARAAAEDTTEAPAPVVAPAPVAEPRPPAAAPPAFKPLKLPRAEASGVSSVTGKPLPVAGSASDAGGSTRTGSALTSVRSVVSSAVPPPSSTAGPQELKHARAASKERALGRPPRASC